MSPRSADTARARRTPPGPRGASAARADWFPLSLTVRTGGAGGPRADAVVVFADAGREEALADAGLPAPVRREIRRQWDTGPVAVVPALGLHAATVVVGVRRPDWSSPHAVLRRAGAVARAIVRERLRSARVLIPADVPDECAEALVAGLSRGAYRFDRYATRRHTTLPSFALVAPRASWARAAQDALALAEAVWLARDLVNTPAEDMGPAELEKAARRVARGAGLRVRVLDARACARLGMGALTAVGRASPRPPRLVVLEYRPAGRTAAARAGALALVGKGIVFDTGGLDLKTAAGMELMKKDMAGAAAVLAAAWACGKRRPGRPVRFYLAIAENAVAGNAMRPGDVLTALDGTTIEVGNTDAEGRLVLADAVALAVREGATRIVDAATLTGAALTALGRVRVPLVANDDTLCADVERAAEASGEKVWRLPSDPEYRDLFRSRVADLRNTTRGGEAGTIVGGLFVGHFAGKVPWAHLDISPASWTDAAGDLGPEGATGTIVATLARMASS